MSNQNESQNPEESAGSTIGPIDQMYQHFVTHHSDGTMNAEQLHNSRLIFFMAVTMSYNFMLDTIRKDPSLTLLTAISAGMKTNIEAYFDSNPQPVMNIH